jgi:ribosomal protein S18 acetylase RimI-like enzyme
MIAFETSRLRVLEVAAVDLEALLPVYTSHPDFVARMEGSEGEAGRYDLARWQRDWTVAGMMPGRHLLGAYLREDGAPAGIVDFVTEHERDGQPWLGALIIQRDYMRRGLASELCQRVLDHLRVAHAAAHVSSGVAASNTAGLAFLRTSGFREVGQVSHRGPAGAELFLVMERALP